MAKGGGGNTTTVQKSDPWEGVQPYLTGQGAQQSTQGYWETVPGSGNKVFQTGGEGFGWTIQPGTEKRIWHAGTPEVQGTPGLLPEVARVYNQVRNISPYAGALHAGPTSETTTAQNIALGIAPSVLQQGVGIQQYGQDVISGKYTDIANNPYIQSAMAAATDPMKQQLLNEIMPSISSGAVEAGAYGGSRQGVAEANAIDAYLRTAGNIRAGMAQQAYESERKAQNLAPSLIQQGIQTSMMAPDIIGNVGAQRTAEEQALLDEAYQKYMMTVQQPWQNVQNAANILLPAAGLGGTVAGTGTQNTGTNPLGGAVGGAYMGYKLSAGNPYGAAAGALAGYLMSR